MKRVIAALAAVACVSCSEAGTVTDMGAGPTSTTVGTATSTTQADVSSTSTTQAVASTTTQAVPSRSATTEALTPFVPIDEDCHEHAPALNAGDPYRVQDALRGCVEELGLRLYFWDPNTDDWIVRIQQFDGQAWRDRFLGPWCDATEPLLRQLGYPKHIAVEWSGPDPYCK